MKFWKGNSGTSKEGQCGTTDDEGFVPDSIECSRIEYETFIATLPSVIDLAREEYKKFGNDGQRVAYIAKKMGLV